MTTRSTISLSTAALAVLTAIVVAGCGASSGGGATAAKPAPKAASGGTTTVGVAKRGPGRVLVDSSGRTLYVFAKDTGSKSTCDGECAKDWPPAPAPGKPTAGGGAMASLVGTTTRAGGTMQVTYHGHPLYRYEGDRQAGDTNGQGLVAFGGAWYVASPAGQPITGGGASSSSGGTGY